MILDFSLTGRVTLGKAPSLGFLLRKMGMIILASESGREGS